MKNLLLFLASSILSPLIFAQSNGTLRGIIKDGNNKPLEAATLLLFKDSSVNKTGLTNQQGEFIFDRLDNGKYYLSITATGFNSLKTDQFTIDSNFNSVQLPIITLAPAAKTLNNVTVTAQKPFIERKIDRLVINVGVSATNIGLSAFEVIEKSPGVTVDENENIGIQGKDGTIIYIDGKQSYLRGKDLANYLHSIPSNQVDQIEIITQPSGKYDAGTTGIINIRTKRNTSTGFNGNIGANAIFAHHFKFNNSLNLNWKKNNWSFFFNYSYFSNTSAIEFYTTSNYRVNSTKNYNRYSTQTKYSLLPSHPHNLKFAVDYNVSKSATIGINLTGYYDDKRPKTNGYVYIYDSLKNLIQYDRYNTEAHNIVRNPGLNFNLSKKFGKNAELTADADYVSFNNPGTQISTDIFYDPINVQIGSPALLNAEVPVKIDIYSFKSDLSTSISQRTKLEAGIKTSFVKTDNNAEFTRFDYGQSKWYVDTGRTNHFIYKETIHAAYLNSTTQLKNFTLQASLRAEQTISYGIQLIKQSEFRRTYTGLFPSLFIRYARNDSNIFIVSYGKGIRRPTYQDLNPFLYTVNTYSFIQGNPDLKAAISNNFEVSFTWRNQLSIAANYSKTDRMLNAIFVTKPQGISYATLQTVSNIASRTNVGVVISYNKSLTKWWNLTSSVNIYNNQFIDYVNDETIKEDINVITGNLNNVFRFKKGWSVNAFGNFRSRRLESRNIYVPFSGVISFGANKTILNGKGTLTLNVQDPFALLKSKLEVLSETLDSHTRTTFTENRRVIIGFSCRFGKINQLRRRNTSSSQDEQNRVTL